MLTCSYLFSKIEESWPLNVKDFVFFIFGIRIWFLQILSGIGPIISKHEENLNFGWRKRTLVIGVQELKSIHLQSKQKQHTNKETRFQIPCQLPPDKQTAIQQKSPDRPLNQNPFPPLMPSVWKLLSMCPVKIRTRNRLYQESDPLQEPYCSVSYVRKDSLRTQRSKSQKRYALRPCVWFSS